MGQLPGSRGHHSLLSLSPHWLLLYGGALCNPGCKCYGDSWILGTGEAAAAGGVAWRQLNASDAPIHRYRQSLVLAPPADADTDPQLRELYLFGGESYKPYMYHNAVNRLQLRLPSSSAADPPTPAAAAGAAVEAVAGVIADVMASVDAHVDYMWHLAEEEAYLRCCQEYVVAEELHTARVWAMQDAEAEAQQYEEEQKKAAHARALKAKATWF